MVKKGPAQISRVIILFLTAVLPLFFIPTAVDPGNWQKRALLAVGTIILLAVWILQTLASKHARLVFTRFSSLFFLVPVLGLISSLFTGNILYHLSSFPITWLVLALFVVLGSTLAQGLQWRTVVRTLFIPASILVAVAFLQLTPLAFSEMLNAVFKTGFAKTLAFTPADSLLSLITFVVPVGLAGLLLQPQGERDANTGRDKIWSAVLLLAGIFIAVYGFARPETRPFILPWGSGWNIAVEALKTPRSLLLGFGPNSFLNAFHSLRGIGYNATNFWNVRFATSSSELLFFITTTGLVATAAMLFTFKNLLAQLARLGAAERSLFAFALFHVVAFFALPFTPLLWFTLGLTLLMAVRALSGDHPERITNNSVWVWEWSPNPASSWVPAGVTSAIAAALGLGLAVALFQILHANFLFGWSLKQSTTAQAEVIYNAQTKVMQIAPYHPEYRRAIASTSFALVQGMSQKATQDQVELTEEQSTLSLQLLQQAIDQARNAIALDASSTESWELLGNIYSGALNVNGAPDWAIAARTQAIQTDPTNPNLRLALGQLYGQLNQPQQALNSYEQAIQLNPRWVQPYFAFGDTALNLKNGAAAVTAFQKTLELMDPNAAERSVVEERLKSAQELAAQQAEEAKKQQEAAAKKPAQDGAETETSNTQSNENLTVPEQPQAQTPPGLTSQPDGFENLVEGETFQN